MMGKKSDENSRALALNETVGENYSPTSSQNILHVDVLYNIKRKKYQTVCAELAFAMSPSTEWS